MDSRPLPLPRARFRCPSCEARFIRRLPGPPCVIRLGGPPPDDPDAADLPWFREVDDVPAVLLDRATALVFLDPDTPEDPPVPDAVVARGLPVRVGGPPALDATTRGPFLDEMMREHLATSQVFCPDCYDWAVFETALDPD